MAGTQGHSWFRLLTRTPNSFRRGPSTRHARKLRRMATQRINARKAHDAARRIQLERRLDLRIQQVTDQLRPEHRLELQAELAWLQAARDSLEDDGVLPDRKTINA